MLDAEKAKEQIADILRKEEYRVYNQQNEGLLASLWNKAKEWLVEQLMKLFPSAETAGSVANFIIVIILLVVIILIGIGIYFFIRYRGKNKRLRDRSPLQNLAEKDWTYQMHVQEAKRTEDIQAYTLAARHLFLALLLYFHEQEWLERRIWKTNWEYYAELKSVHKEWAEAFYRMAKVFDEITYGERKLTKEEYMDYRKQVMKRLQKSGEGEGSVMKG
ncbi:DUF4129 domain-containing protein [Cerasibacillus terrae]|uniref:DUF4129 domain-containing protein n=1 Tax=Cerasibacillus terrae TaxID=2498845 RepID=A0A5C8NT92_9BACI|nr:DUF4129 domain-containing protein [Cerasibacillus terrae]TXL64428.1 DUF4129 domain-containing protein [Cerasibacillus terrae]